MGLGDDLLRFAGKSKTNLGAIRAGADVETFRSIVEGSEITGAPGQPVGKSGKLHDSWTQEVTETETVTSSPVPYAQAVEENWGNVTYANHGPHSVKQTAVNFDRIVATVARRVVG